MTKPLQEILKEEADDYVAEFNSIPKEAVGEFGSDLHLYHSGANKALALVLERLSAILEEADTMGETFDLLRELFKELKEPSHDPS